MVSGGDFQRLTVTGDLLETVDMCDQPDELAQKDPQVPEDHADVVTPAAEHGEQSVTVGSLQGVSGQSAVVLHVSDHWFDGASSAQQFRDGPGDAAPGAAEEDIHGLDAVAAVTAIDEGHLWALIGQDFHLLQRLVQGVAVIRVARQ